MRVPSTCVVPENCLMRPTTVQTMSKVKWLLNKVMTKEFGKYWSCRFRNQRKIKLTKYIGLQLADKSFLKDYLKTLELPTCTFWAEENLLSRTRRRGRQGGLAWSLMFLSLYQFDFWSFRRWMIILFYWHHQCQSSTKAWNHCFYFLSCCTLCVKRRGH